MEATRTTAAPVARAARAAATPATTEPSVQDDALECLSAEDCLEQFRETRLLAVRNQQGGDGGERRRAGI